MTKLDGREREGVMVGAIEGGGRVKGGKEGKHRGLNRNKDRGRGEEIHKERKVERKSG